MKQVKQIILGFENCEDIWFESNEIASIDIEGIKSSINRVTINSIEELTSCESCSIVLLPKADTEYMTFCDERSEYSKFERILRFDDITSVTAVYENGDGLEIYVPWKENAEAQCGAAFPNETNVNQYSYLSKNGALYIYIDENGKRLDDVFDLNTIDDPAFKVNLAETLYE